MTNGHNLAQGRKAGMSARAPLPLVLALLTLALLGCGRSSPTAPPSAGELLGTWEGALEAYPAGEDWSRVRVKVEAVGGTLRGTLTSRNGVVHPVSVESGPDCTYLGVGVPPQSAPCSVTLAVERVSFSTMEGRLGGRCPNTLMGRFQMERSR